VPPFQGLLKAVLYQGFVARCRVRLHPGFAAPRLRRCRLATELLLIQLLHAASKTCFRLVAILYRVGLSTHRVILKGFVNIGACYSPFPALVWRDGIGDW